MKNGSVSSALMRSNLNKKLLMYYKSIISYHKVGFFLLYRFVLDSHSTTFIFEDTVDSRAFHYFTASWISVFDFLFWLLRYDDFRLCIRVFATHDHLAFSCDFFVAFSWTRPALKHRYCLSQFWPLLAFRPLSVTDFLSLCFVSLSQPLFPVDCSFFLCLFRLVSRHGKNNCRISHLWVYA